MKQTRIDPATVEKFTAKQAMLVAQVVEDFCSAIASIRIGLPPAIPAIFVGTACASLQECGVPLAALDAAMQDGMNPQE